MYGTFPSTDFGTAYSAPTERPRARSGRDGHIPVPEIPALSLYPKM